MTLVKMQYSLKVCDGQQNCSFF